MSPFHNQAPCSFSYWILQGVEMSIACLLTKMLIAISVRGLEVYQKGQLTDNISMNKARTKQLYDFFHLILYTVFIGIECVIVL